MCITANNSPLSATFNASLHAQNDPEIVSQSDCREAILNLTDCGRHMDHGVSCCSEYWVCCEFKDTKVSCAQELDIFI